MTKAKRVHEVTSLHDTAPPKAKSFGPCFETHPPLLIGDFTIYGGSCSRPIVTDADIYVGFDGSHLRSIKAYPWEEGESFYFPIQDMQAPSDPKQFAKLIDWLAVQLAANKKIHLGCIGGHGRTGTALAALVKVVTGEEDAISYVRKNYCDRAVESSAQIRFLQEHYGIKEVAVSKHDYYSKAVTQPPKQNSKQDPLPLTYSEGGLPSYRMVAKPTKNPMLIWVPGTSIFDKH